MQLRTKSWLLSLQGGIAGKRSSYPALEWWTIIVVVMLISASVME